MNINLRGGIIREELHHQKIFDIYFAMGENRSLAKLYDALSSGLCQEYDGVVPSYPTVKYWSKKFNWQERITQRNIELSKKMEQKTNTTVLNQKADYRKIIKEAIDDWYKKFSDGKAGPENVSDLERLMKLDLLLMGEATEKNEGQIINIIVKGK